MHTDKPHKEKPTGSANYPAGHTDSQTLTGPVAQIKSRLMALAVWLATVLQGVA